MNKSLTQTSRSLRRADTSYFGDMGIGRPFSFVEQFQFDEFFYYLSCFSTLCGVFMKKIGRDLEAEGFLVRGVHISEKFSHSMVVFADAELLARETETQVETRSHILLFRLRQESARG